MGRFYYRAVRVFVLAAVCIAGCGRTSVGDNLPKNIPATAPDADSGIIRGKVLLIGEAPARKMIPASPNAKDESIVVGAGGGLKNVIVFLRDAPAATFLRQAPVVLDQINCTYVPHVIAVQAGETIRLKSSDNLMHNVHLQCSANPDSNYGFAAPGQRDITLAQPEMPFPVKCDVHPWMTAWIGVMANPWFAVSAEDGTFEIDHVPPGTYTLVAWQEVLPQQEQTITVGDGPSSVTFNFPAP